MHPEALLLSWALLSNVLRGRATFCHGMRIAAALLLRYRPVSNACRCLAYAEGRYQGMTGLHLDGPGPSGTRHDLLLWGADNIFAPSALPRGIEAAL